MVKNKLSRIKAAVVTATMVATTLAAPVMTTFTSVTAATKEVSSLPYTLTADGVEDGLRQANIALPDGTKKGDTIYLNFKTSSTVDAAIGVYGFGTTSEKDGAANGGYWYSVDESFASDGKSSFSCEVVIPSAMVGNPTKVGVGIWYPEDDSKWTLESITTEKTGEETPAEPNIPVTANNKSGTCEVIINDDNTATIISTLSAQYSDTSVESDDPTQFDYLLTQGTDEEDYAPYKDADGNVLPTRQEGDPINSHKFDFGGFGIDDMSNIRFQSFEYAIKSDEYDMSTIQYGGGINVKQGSPADTEAAKGKDGYWYNDQGKEDLEKYAADFKDAGVVEDVHSGYEATGCGSYAEITWDVPVGVQEYVETSLSNAVGIQYWWGKDDTKSTPNEDGEDLGYTEIPEIHLVSCTATYTRTMTVPYTETVDGPTGSKLTSGSDTTNQIKFPLADLELGERDKLSAIKFTITTTEPLDKFVGGYGISLDSAKAPDAAGGDGSWYQPGNVTVINCEKNTFDVMWILPEAVRDAVYPDGEVLIGYWYGDIAGTPVDSVTVSDVEYYVFRSQEEDLEIKTPDGLDLPESIDLKVGETYDLIVNVEGTEFESSSESVATVDENGTITAKAQGISTITVKTPEGQEKMITVNVSAAETTPAQTSATTTTTTKATTATTVTTVDPDSIIDWSRVLYGDVNVDGQVTLADIAVLSKHVLAPDMYPLINATATENANCQYDDAIDAADSLKIIEYKMKSITLLDLGKPDKSDCPLYETIKE